MIEKKRKVDNLPVDIVGQAYELDSVNLSAQVCKNLFVEVHPDGKTNKALIAWPGKKSFSTGSGLNRGIMSHPWNSNVYVVNDTTLYKVGSDGTQTSIGTIAGTARCDMFASASHVYVITDGVVYRTDGATLSTVTDSDLETPNAGAFLNSQIIYDGDSGRFVVSDAGDGSSIDGLNYATAEALPDDIIRPFVFDQVLYLCGERSIEPWYNSGVGSPPFDRIEGGLINVGIAGIFSITSTSQAVYFLGNDRTVYRLAGYNEQQVSTIAINNAIESYGDVSDCIAMSLRWQGQAFVIFQFPSANKTWAFNEMSQTWLELSSNGGRDLINGYCYAFNKHLVTDYQTGNIYELDKSTYDENGDTLIRERVTRPISGLDINKPGIRILLKRFEFIVETGVGLATGQGVDPVFIVSCSVDGGRTWQDEQFISPGVMGDYTKKVEYFTFASGYEILIKIRVSDPIKVSIHAAGADIETHGY